MLIILFLFLYSPYYNDTHRAVRKVVREFVDKEVTPFCHEWDEAKQLPRELYIKAAKAGILGACVGQVSDRSLVKYPLPGGVKYEEFDSFHRLITMDELSRCASGGVAWALIGGLSIGLGPIIHFASKELQEHVIPGCLDGTKNICLAITEPSGGSDVANLGTEAKDMGDHFLVNGEKKWITNGGKCNSLAHPPKIINSFVFGSVC